MQVEHVTGEGLPSRWAPQQQRHLAVGLGLLGQVVVDDQGVLAVLHPVLAHGAPGVGGEVLVGGRVRRRGHHYHRVLHGAELVEGGHRLGHGGGLLADGHVDAVHVEAALVEDGVEGDGGLAGLAVADDQLALAPADGDERVDGLDAGLHRLVHRLAPGDARRLDLHAPRDRVRQRALAVHRLAQRVDHPSEQAVAHRDRQDVAGGLHRLALLDALHVAEDDRADGGLVEVQGQADRAVGEAQHLVDGRVGQARDPGDAVAHLEHPAHGGLLQRGREPFEVLTDGRRDVGGVDRELCRVGHVWSLNLLCGGPAPFNRARLASAAGGCARCRRSRRRRSR